MTDTAKVPIKEMSPHYAALKEEGKAPPIKELKPHDVLFGRGVGPSNYVGNQQFRKIVAEHKDEYKSNVRNKSKAKIAKEIYDRIHSLGGRFLRLDENAVQVEFATEDPGEWFETEEKAALEKIKQSLRQKQVTKQKKTSRSTNAKQKVVATATASVVGTETNVANVPNRKRADVLHSLSGHIPSTLCSRIPSDSVCVGTSPCSSMLYPCLSSSILPLQLVGVERVCSVFDPRLCLFQSPPTLALCPSQIFQTYSVDGKLSVGETPYADAFHAVHFASDGTAAPNRIRDLGKKRSRSTSNEPENCSEDVEVVQLKPNQEHSLITESECPQDNQDDFLQYLLSVLALSDRATFTDQQSNSEMASLTDRERADALSDLFGRTCSLDNHEDKKPRKDLDVESIDFLVEQMRIEIGNIPNEKKQSFLEARSKASADEFSDERLTKFLRCEGMNAELAANRFVNYWQSRREVFGPDKYWQQMTLNEALCDDIVALQTAVYCLLPGVDANGRPIIFHCPPRHTREGGYSSESLLRAVWYVVEIASQENNDLQSRIVEVMWCQNSTLWDYDRKVHDRINYFRDNAWPVRVAALHVCCLSRLIVRIIKPIMMAMKTKSSRCRTLFHDVPESEIITTLSKYGLLGSMLPSAMGGSLRFDHSDWIAKRRAAELQEIE